MGTMIFPASQPASWAMVHSTTVLADQTESARQVPELGGESCNPRREASARQ